MRILFVGDVVGRPGRDAIEALLPGIRERLDVDLCIVNGENVANGVGITPRLAERLLASGADALTLGNHAWRREEIGPYLASSGTVVRPANFQAAAPGRGLTVVDARDGTAVAVINLLGSLFLDPAHSMWEVVDELVEEARAATPVVVVDLHAEATSEKVALALVARRPRDGGARDAHARPDGRRPRPARRHGRDHRRRDDRAARLRDRGRDDARNPPDAHRDARPVRDGVRRRAPRGRGRHVRPGDGAGERDRARAEPVAGHVRTARSARSVTPRASTSHEASGSNSFTSSQ